MAVEKATELVGGVVTQTAELAEKATATTFGIVRDVRAEIHQRVLDSFALLDGTQQGFIKLLRGINDRADKLSDEVIDMLESLTVKTLRTMRDTSLPKPREIRAA